MTPSTSSVQMSDSHSVSARHSHECLTGAPEAPEAPKGSTIFALSVPLVAFLLTALMVKALLAYSSRRF
jgi:hypothetical protein